MTDYTKDIRTYLETEREVLANLDEKEISDGCSDRISNMTTRIRRL